MSKRIDCINGYALVTATDISFYGTRNAAADIPSHVEIPVNLRQIGTGSFAFDGNSFPENEIKKVICRHPGEGNSNHVPDAGRIKLQCDSMMINHRTGKPY